MQEIFLLIHLLFTALECLSLLLGETAAALLFRLCTAAIVAWCHWRRHSCDRRQHHSQLLYLFIALDLASYLLIGLLLLLAFTRSYAAIWVLLMWLQAWARAYNEFGAWSRDHVIV